MKIIVTGGCGFIGSHFIEEILKLNNIEKVYNIDCETYAANKNLNFENDSRYQKLSIDISASYFIDQKKYLESLGIDYVIHFAAESHVDNSIKGPQKFIYTNIIGTFNLIEIFKNINIKKFIHVSTDEVFGSLNFEDAPFDKNSQYRPNSPYSATKAASDLLVRSYFQTYKFPAIITNCSNNYGPRQFPEKLIPVCIKKLINKEPIPLYGNGKNIRDWIFVKDNVKALINVMLNGEVGDQYLIGGNKEISNYDLINTIAHEYTKLTSINIDWQLFNFVEDRKGHDIRYSIDTKDYEKKFSKIEQTDFNYGLRETIKFYL
jgi:dTDP-glucose 4,6-dehydratase